MSKSYVCNVRTSLELFFEKIDLDSGHESSAGRILQLIRIVYEIFFVRIFQTIKICCQILQYSCFLLEKKQKLLLKVFYAREVSFACDVQWILALIPNSVVFDKRIGLFVQESRQCVKTCRIFKKSNFVWVGMKNNMLIMSLDGMIEKFFYSVFPLRYIHYRMSKWIT